MVAGSTTNLRGISFDSEVKIYLSLSWNLITLKWAVQYDSAVRFAIIPPAVHNRITPVQPKRFLRQPCSRRRLEALVFADIQQMLDLFGHIALKSGGDAIFNAAILIH